MIAWYDVAIFLAVWLAGNVVFRAFALGVPWWKRALKLVVALAIALPVGYFLGRLAFYGLIAGYLVALGIIHAIVLPRRGVHGITGKPLRPPR